MRKYIVSTDYNLNLIRLFYFRSRPRTLRNAFRIFALRIKLMFT